MKKEKLNKSNIPCKCGKRDARYKVTNNRVKEYLCAYCLTEPFNRRKNGVRN